MAIIATLTGGFFGFVSFLVAFFVLDFGFYQATVVYAAVGVSVILTLIAIFTVARALPKPDRARLTHAKDNRTAVSFLSQQR